MVFENDGKARQYFVRDCTRSPCVGIDANPVGLACRDNGFVAGDLIFSEGTDTADAGDPGKDGEVFVGKCGAQILDVVRTGEPCGVQFF